MYLVDGESKVDVGEYLQVGHRIVHVDDLGRFGIEVAALSAQRQVWIRSLRQENRALVVTLEGQARLQDLGPLIEKIRNRWIAGRYQGLLLDLADVAFDLNEVAQYYLVHDLIHAGCHLLGRLAVVTEHGLPRFLVAAAKNRMIPIQTFETEQAGLAWLADGRCRPLQPRRQTL